MTTAEFRKLWCDRSVPVSEIAKRLGLTANAVAKRARARDLPRRGKGGHNAVVVGPEFAAMWRAGVFVRDIAAFYGAGTCMPPRTAARLGLPPRRQGWTDGITLAEYKLRLLASAMAAAATETRQLMKVCEMVDHPSCGKSKVAA